MLTQQQVDMKLGHQRNYHKRHAAVRHYAYKLVPYDLCMGLPIPCLLSEGSTSI